MNLHTINHRLNNFSTELTTIEKAGLVKTYTRDEAQRIENRVIFLEEQISILKEEKSDLVWAMAMKA